MRRNGMRKGRKRLLARACYGLLAVLLCTLFTLFYQPMTSHADSIPADIAAFPGPQGKAPDLDLRSRAGTGLDHSREQ